MPINCIFFLFFALSKKITLLVAAKCSPSLVNEMLDCRAATGEKAKFKVQFAGNPKPGIVLSNFRKSSTDILTNGHT